MAKRTNKTDHVLNLLSQGKKSGSAAPPVQLKKAESEETAPEPAEAAALEQDGQEEEERQETVQSSAAKKTSSQEEQVASAESSPAEPKEVPQVSVVHTSSEENPIAESVKDALEAELEDYLKENPDSGDLLRKTDHTDKEDLPDLPDLPEQTTAEKAEDLPDLPDLPDETRMAEPVAAEETSGGEPEESPDLPDLPETAEQWEQTASVVTEAEALEEVPAAEEPVQEKADVQPEPQAAAAETVSPELKEAEKTGAEEPAPAAEQNPNPAPEPEAMPEAQDESAVIQTEEAQTVSQEVQTPAANAAPEPKTETPAPVEKQPKEDEPDFATVNVMEYLVREQAPRYIRQFGHCDCGRCIEDTIALALTHLPAKYVVVNKNAISPLLNFYEKRFAGQLIVEITKASMTVDEFPHH